MKKGFAPILIIFAIFLLVTSGYLINKQFLGWSFVQKPTQIDNCCDINPEDLTRLTEQNVPTQLEIENAKWKTYNGLNFSFQHPSSWKDEPISASLLEDTVIESKRLRINTAVFNTDYNKITFEERTENYQNRETQDLLIQNKKAKKYIFRGEGDPLPKDYSIITFIVEGSNGHSYLINFNGPNVEINDELIDQILSTFKFLE